MKKLLCLLMLLLPSVSFAFDAPVFFGYEVVVTATKRLQPAWQSPMRIRSVTQEEIRYSGAGSVSDVLKKVPGIYIKSNGGAGGISTFRLKNASGQQLLVLINGTRVNSTLLGLVDLADISTDNVKRIEIVDESASSLYGADAVGGVVNIITESPSDRPLAMAYRSGSYGLASFTANIATSLGGRTGGFTVHSERTDGFRQNGDYKQAKISYQGSITDLIKIDLSVADSERGNPGVPANDTDRTSASLPGDRQKDRYENYSVRIGGRADDPASLTVYANNSKEQVRYEDWFIRGSFTDDTYESRSTGADINYSWPLNRSAKMVLGAETRADLGISPKVGDKYARNDSAYFNFEAGIGHPVSSYLGVRYDQNTAYGSSLNPRAGIIYNIAGGSRLAFSVATAFRAPTMNELYWNDPSFGSFGNQNLKPERSLSANLTFSNEIFSLNLYRNELNDMIRWAQTGPWTWQPVNIDRAKVEGAVLEVKKDLAKNVRLSLDLNAENAIDAGTGRVLPYSPAQKAGAKLFLGDEKFFMNLSGRFAPDVYYDAGNTKVIPSHTVMDVDMGWDLGSAQIDVGIHNLTDEKYYESVGTSPADWKERGYPMPGRTYQITAKLGF